MPLVAFQKKPNYQYLFHKHFKSRHSSWTLYKSWDEKHHHDNYFFHNILHLKHLTKTRNYSCCSIQLHFKYILVHGTKPTAGNPALTVDLPPSFSINLGHVGWAELAAHPSTLSDIIGPAFTCSKKKLTEVYVLPHKRAGNLPFHIRPVPLYVYSENSP